MLRAWRSQTGNDGNFKLQIKTELPLDRAVKWLCVYMVGILGAFLVVMMIFLKGKEMGH